MKAIVIGANGYIGRHLCQLGKEYGMSLKAFDIQSESIDQVDSYQTLDIKNQQQIETIDFNVDFIFMMAGLSGTKAGLDHHENYVDINEKGLLNVLSQIKNLPQPPRVIFPSSRLVYKGQKDIPLKEDAVKEFKSIYAVNKFACENYLEIYRNCFNISYTIFRICVPYGNLIDDKYSYGTLGFMMGKALEGKNIPIYGDGSQKRTFSHIEDVTRLMIEASLQENTKNTVFNIGGDTLSLYDVANSVALKYNVQVELINWPELDLKIESGDTIFDGGKLANACDYSFKHSFSEWLSLVATC